MRPPEPGDGPRRAGPLGVGLAVAGAYVLVALITPRWTGRPLVPLFDGFAPPAPYAWVNPPAEFAKDNRKPSDATQDVALDPGGTVAANASTADGQAIAGVDAGSAPPHFPDTTVRLHITPLDPGTLGPLPAGLRPEGNAYQVTLTYEPSGQAVTTLAKPGTIALTAAASATNLLFSADGKAWQNVQAQPFGGSNGLFAQLTGPGYFVTASHNPPRAAASKPGKSGGSGAAVVVGVVAAVAIVAGIAVALLATRGRRRPPPKGKSKAKGNPKPGPGKGPRRPRGS